MVEPEAIDEKVTDDSVLMVGDSQVLAGVTSIFAWATQVSTFMWKHCLLPVACSKFRSSGDGCRFVVNIADSFDTDDFRPSGQEVSVIDGLDEQLTDSSSPALPPSVSLRVCNKIKHKFNSGQTWKSVSLVSWLLINFLYTMFAFCNRDVRVPQTT